MKRNLLFVFAMTVCVALTAQVPNGNFETWTKNDREVISGWNSQGTHSKVSGPNSDNAIRIETDEDDNIGVVAYVDFEEDTDNLRGGFAYSGGKPAKIKVNMRYNIPTGDTAAVIISASASGIPISIDFNRITGSQNTFTDQEFIINYFATATPDSFVVGFASGSIEGNAIAGGWMEISNVEFIDENNGTMADIPNGDFETWKTVSYYTLDGWNTSSDYLRIFGSDIENVTRTPEYSSGTYGIHLQTIKIEEDTIAGIAFTAKTKNDFEIEDPAFEVDEKFLSIQGKYKYKPVGNDSFTVNAVLYFQGSIIGSCQFKEGATQTEYTFFSKDFTYHTPLTPDSATVAIFSSDIDNPISVGSELWLDELTFKEWTTNLNEMENSSMKLYPNPAKESTRIEFNTTSVQQVQLKNANGQVLKNYGEVQSSIEISLTDLPCGIYYVTSTNHQSSTTQKLIIQ